MVKKIKHVVLNRPKRMVATNDDPTKGTQTNPYTQEEFYAMLDNETWTVGWVEGMGYALPAVDIVTSFLFDFSWDSWDLWSSWGMYDSWYESNIVIPITNDGEFGGGGNGSNGGSGINNNAFTIRIVFTDNYIPSNEAVMELVNQVKILPQQLRYLYGFIPFTFINPLNAKENIAYYNLEKRTIHLYENNIALIALTHELFHAWQHNYGYISEGFANTSYYNVEFETYVTLDLKDTMALNGIPNTMTMGLENEAYNQFLINSLNEGHFDYSYFISHVYNFFDIFIDLHRRVKDRTDTTGNGIPSASELANPNYQWHWTEYLRFWNIME